MKKLFLFPTLLLAPFFLRAQNVGIGTLTPAEKLDVNGNINVTGTIKANGVDGLAGQALMKNSAGTFSWGNITQYTNVLGFRSGSSTTSNTIYSWIVPASITKIFVELWGGGGGGASGGGGGGGGYAACQWTVTPGATVNITIGAAGAGAVSGAVDAVDGNSSVVQITTVQVVAYGGEGGHTSLGGIPGGFTTNASGLFVYGSGGQAGQGNNESYGVYSATVYYTAINYGSGGAGGNTVDAQKNGGFKSMNTSTSALIKNVYSQVGTEPGGGGGGDNFGGKNGGPGMVIIHF